MKKKSSFSNFNFAKLFRNAVNNNMKVVPNGSSKKASMSSSVSSNRASKKTILKNSSISGQDKVAAGVLLAETEMKNSARDGVALQLVRNFIASRKHSDPRESYTAYLASVGMEEMNRLLVDEAVQFAMRCVSDADNEGVVMEAADLIYNLMVILEHRGLSLSDVNQEIVSRVIDSGFQSEIFRKLRDGVLLEEDIIEYIINNKINSPGVSAKLLVAKSKTGSSSKKSSAKKTSAKKSLKKKSSVAKVSVKKAKVKSAGSTLTLKAKAKKFLSSASSAIKAVDAKSKKPSAKKSLKKKATVSKVSVKSNAKAKASPIAVKKKVAKFKTTSGLGIA